MAVLAWLFEVEEVRQGFYEKKTGQKKPTRMKAELSHSGVKETLCYLQRKRPETTKKGRCSCEQRPFCNLAPLSMIIQHTLEDELFPVPQMQCG